MAPGSKGSSFLSLTLNMQATIRTVSVVVESFHGFLFLFWFQSFFGSDHHIVHKPKPAKMSLALLNVTQISIFFLASYSVSLKNFTI